MGIQEKILGEYEMGMNEVLKFFMEIYSTSTIPVRFAYIYWILFVLTYILLSSHEKSHDLTKKREVKFKNYHGTLYLFGALAIILHHGSIYAEWGITKLIATNANSVFWLGVIGFITMLYGLYLVAVARIALDGYWGVHVYKYDKEENGGKGKLVDTGIYKHCRHPVYAGQIFMTIGTVLLANDWLVGVLPAGTFVLSIWRAVLEERDLKERFGHDFESYKNTTSFIIPYIK